MNLVPLAAGSASTEMLSLMPASGGVSRLGFGAFADRFGGLMTLFVGNPLQLIVSAGTVSSVHMRTDSSSRVKLDARTGCP